MVQKLIARLKCQLEVQNDTQDKNNMTHDLRSRKYKNTYNFMQDQI